MSQQLSLCITELLSKWPPRSGCLVIQKITLAVLSHALVHTAILCHLSSAVSLTAKKWKSSLQENTFSKNIQRLQKKIKIKNKKWMNISAKWQKSSRCKLRTNVPLVLNAASMIVSFSSAPSKASSPLWWMSFPKLWGVDESSSSRPSVWCPMWSDFQTSHR